MTQKEARGIERRQIEAHKKLHKIENKKKSRSAESDTTLQMQVEREYHAAEIPSSYTEQTSRQTTSNTTYTDVPGTTVTSGLAANRDHLVIVCAQIDAATSGGDVFVRLVRGTTPTAEADSEMIYDPAVDPVSMVQRWPYYWWGVINPGGSAQDVKLQYCIGTASGNSGNSAGLDLVSILIIQLNPDLVANTNYKYDLNSSGETITLSGATLGDVSSDSATANASITLTPSVSGHKWLILSKGRYTGSPSSCGVRSRIKRSGGASTELPVMQKEGEDATNEAIVLSGMRTDTLTNASNTYAEISNLANTGGTGSVTRTHSGIFMLDLDSFQTVAVNNEDTGEEDIASTTDYGSLVHTMNVTPTTAGNCAILGFCTGDYGASGSSTIYYKMRMQVDNADQPANQTTKAYALQQNDTDDRLPCMFATRESLTAASHTIDLDGSVHTTAGAGRGTYARSIAAFSMELSATARTFVANETSTITEGKVFLRGLSQKFVQSELSTITEGKVFTAGSSSNFVTAGLLQIRLSGGASNSNPLTSYGGIKSSVSAGLTLFDNVTLTEATTGDTEYRCVYLHNSHASLQMLDLKVWISGNTPGGDEVSIGAGVAGANGTETAVANENTAPASVAFTSAAVSQATAVSLGNVSAAQHYGLWIRRAVPAGTTTYSNNNFFITVHWESNFS